MNPSRVPALTLHQPWAWMMIHGGKLVENRPWTTRIRGPVFIHAAKSMPRRQYRAAAAFAGQAIPVRRRKFRLPEETRLPSLDALKPMLPPPSELNLGGIIGWGWLQDVLPPAPPEQTAGSWRMPGQFGLVFRETHPLPFMPMGGGQRWWYPMGCSSRAPTRCREQCVLPGGHLGSHAFWALQGIQRWPNERGGGEP